MKIINIDSYFKPTRGYYFEDRLVRALGSSLILATLRTEPEIIQACDGCEVVVLEHPNTPLSATVIDGLNDCRLIVKYSVGLDNVDVSAATERGIIVCHAPYFCVEEVSDHAVALILCLARKVVQFNDHVHREGWAGRPLLPPLRRIRNRVLGLVGFGRIARLVAQKMKGFGMTISTSDPFIDEQTAKAHGTALVSMEKLFAESDFISVHTPLTKETRHLIGPRLLELMKPTSFLVNTSRGPVIDEAALVVALTDKQIAGAALDVAEVEPLPASSPLRALNNVIITPHCAANSADSLNDLRHTGAASIEAYCKGYWPEFPANPQVRPKHVLKPWAEFAASPNRLVRVDAAGQLVDPF
ncbi:MAG: C-terminal binding protein [Candidatus Acidiferrales bacterium]